MNLEQLSQYVTAGSVEKEESAFRKQSLLTIAFAVLLGFLCATVKGFGPYMIFAMCLVSLICVVTVFKISSDIMSVKGCLWADAIISGSLIFEFSMAEFVCFTMWKGLTPWVLLVYVPVILIPVFLCIRAHRVLKHASCNPQKPTKGNIGHIGFWSGIIGMHLAAILFRSVDENTFPLIGLVCAGILNCFVSIGLTSLQKLYYIKKYKLFE